MAGDTRGGSLLGSGRERAEQTEKSDSKLDLLITFSVSPYACILALIS
jgi:hypothetical protein